MKKVKCLINENVNGFEAVVSMNGISPTTLVKSSDKKSRTFATRGNAISAAKAFCKRYNLELEVLNSAKV